MSQPLLRHLVHRILATAHDPGRRVRLARAARSASLLPHLPTPGQPVAAGAEDVLAAYRQRWQATLARLARSAVGRLASSPDPLQAPTLFDPAELDSLGDALADSTIAADLLGRSRIRRPWHQAQASKIPDEPEQLPFLPHQRAVAYFRRLVPTLGIDPQRHGELHARRAFTLAVATDTVLLRKVKGAIGRRLETGEFSRGAREVRRLLDETGVTPANPQYADLVWRTNIMDSLNGGASEELAQPDVAAVFPVWQYSGIADGRERQGPLPDHPDHHRWFGRYFPVSVPFTVVRGTEAKDVVNCRCVLPGQYIRGRVLAGSKARYSGQAVEVVTLKGTRFAVTANHPVATARGWVSANHLKKGDRLFHNHPELDRLVISDQVKDRDALAEDVFCAIPQVHRLRVTKRWSTLDFHGDGPAVEGEIEIVTAARSLLLKSHANLGEDGSQFPFGWRDSEQLGLPGDGPARLVPLASVRVITAENDARSPQSESDRPARGPKVLGKSQNRLASHVPVNQLVKRNLSPPFPVNSGANFMASGFQMSPECVHLHPNPAGKGVEWHARQMLRGNRVEVGNYFGVIQDSVLAGTTERNQFLQPFAERLSVHEPQTQADHLDGFACLVAANDSIPVEGLVTGSACFARTVNPVTNSQTKRLESCRQLVPFYPDTFGDAAERFPVGVADDEIQEIRFFHYNGPVYDFMTDEGFYAIGGTRYSMAVVHNCTQIPVDRWTWQELQAHGARVEAWPQ